MDSSEIRINPLLQNGIKSTFQVVSNNNSISSNRISRETVNSISDYHFSEQPTASSTPNRPPVTPSGRLPHHTDDFKSVAASSSASSHQGLALDPGYVSPPRKTVLNSNSASNSTAKRVNNSTNNDFSAENITNTPSYKPKSSIIQNNRNVESSWNDKPIVNGEDSLLSNQNPTREKGIVTRSVESSVISSRGGEKSHQNNNHNSSSFPGGSRALMDELEKDLLSAKGAPNRALTARELDEALLLLKYDMHLEMQSIIKEQIRQFSINQVQTYPNFLYF